MPHYKGRLQVVVQTDVVDEFDTACSAPGWHTTDAYQTADDYMKVTVVLERDFEAEAADEDAAYAVAESGILPIEIAGYKYVSHSFDLLELEEGCTCRFGGAFAVIQGLRCNPS